MGAIIGLVIGFLIGHHEGYEGYRYCQEVMYLETSIPYQTLGSVKEGETIYYALVRSLGGETGAPVSCVKAKEVFPARFSVDKDGHISSTTESK